MRKLKQNVTQLGFTIIEVMIAVTIAGILAAVALPAFGDLLKNNRLTSQANTLLASFNFARSEAINRAVKVRVEPIIAGTDWAVGWQVRIDGNNDNDFSDAADTVIRNFAAIEGGSLVVENTNIYIDFDIDGTAIAKKSDGTEHSTDKTLKLKLQANECTSQHIRKVTVNLGGQSRVVKEYCP